MYKLLCFFAMLVVAAWAKPQYLEPLAYSAYGAPVATAYGASPYVSTYGAPVVAAYGAVPSVYSPYYVR